MRNSRPDPRNKDALLIESMRSLMRRPNPTRNDDLEDEKRLKILALEKIMDEDGFSYQRGVYPTGDDRNTYTGVSYSLNSGISLELSRIWYLRWEDRRVTPKASCEKVEIYSREFKRPSSPLSILAKELATKHGLEYCVRDRSEDDDFVFKAQARTEEEFRRTLRSVYLAQEAYAHAENGLLDSLRQYAGLGSPSASEDKNK